MSVLLKKLIEDGEVVVGHGAVLSFWPDADKSSGKQLEKLVDWLVAYLDAALPVGQQRGSASSIFIGPAGVADTKLVQAHCSCDVSHLSLRVATEEAFDDLYRDLVGKDSDFMTRSASAEDGEGCRTVILFHREIKFHLHLSWLENPPRDPRVGEFPPDNSEFEGLADLNQPAAEEGAVPLGSAVLP